MNSQINSVAIHEASHVLYVSSIPSLTPILATVERHGEEAGRFMYQGDCTWQDEVRVSLAGPIAEQIYRGCNPYQLGDGEDRITALSLVREYGGNLKKLTQETTAWVLAHWRAIEALARDLVWFGELRNQNLWTAIEAANK